MVSDPALLTPETDEQRSWSSIDTEGKSMELVAPGLAKFICMHMHQQVKKPVGQSYPLSMHRPGPRRRRV